MAHVNVYEAKSQLSRLIARVEAGEEIVITRHGRPVARLEPVGETLRPRKLGTLRGKIRVSEDFDAPLPNEVLDSFEALP